MYIYSHMLERKTAKGTTVPEYIHAGTFQACQGC